MPKERDAIGFDDYPKMSSPSPEERRPDRGDRTHRRSHAGVFSFVLAFGSCIGWWAAFFAIGLGIYSIVESRKSRDKTDLGFGIAGISLGALMLIVQISGFVTSAAQSLP